MLKIINQGGSNMGFVNFIRRGGKKITINTSNITAIYPTDSDEDYTIITLNDGYEPVVVYGKYEDVLLKCTNICYML